MASKEPLETAILALAQAISNCPPENQLYASLLSIYSPLQSCVTNASPLPLYLSSRYQNACRKIFDFSHHVVANLPAPGAARLPAQTSENLAALNIDAVKLHRYLDSLGLFTAFSPTYAQQRLWDRIVHCFEQPPGEGLLRGPLIERNAVRYRRMFRSLHDYYSCIQALLATDSILHHLATKLISYLRTNPTAPNRPDPSPPANAICPPADVSRFLKVCGVADKFVSQLDQAPISRNDAVQIKELFHQLCFTGFNFQDRMTFSLSTSSIRFPAILAATRRSVLYPATLHAQDDYENAFWDMPVIVKVFLPEKDTKSREMYYRQESLRINTLSHPCLLTIHDTHWPEDHDGQLNSDIFAVSEHMTHNLRDAISLDTFRSKRIRLLVLIDVLRGLAYLHKSGVVHRDITPENVLVRVYQGEWCGCAKVDITNLLKYAIFPNAQREARHSIYAAPESFTDRKEFYTGDVWSVAVLACYLLTDESPSLPDIPSIIVPQNERRRVIVQMAYTWSTRVPNRNLQTLIQSCLCMDPAERPTADMLVSSFQSAVDRIDLSGQVHDEVIGGENHGDGRVDYAALGTLPDLRNPHPGSDGHVRRYVAKSPKKDPDWIGSNGVPRDDETGSSSSRSRSRSRSRSNSDAGQKKQPSRQAKRKRVISDDSNEDNAAKVGGKHEAPHLQNSRRNMASEMRRIGSPRGGRTHPDELYIGAGDGNGQADAINGVGRRRDIPLPRSRSSGSGASKRSSEQNASSPEIDYSVLVGQNGGSCQTHKRIGVEEQNAKGEIMLESSTPDCMEKAAALFEQAADLGSAKAQVNFGLCLEHGRGVELDLGKAALYYQEAAKLGDAKGQFKIGFCHERGTGTKKDYRVAVEWYTKAAEQGDDKSQTNLGIAYEYGRGVQRNLGKAIEYYRKAASVNNSVALLNLGVMYENGRGVERDITAAVSLYGKAADKGNNLAMHNLALCYEKGYGVRKDMVKAVRYHIKAADGGCSKAQFRAGKCFEYGEGVKKSDVKAYFYYEASAKQGHIDAMCHMGILLEEGRGVVQDFSSAYKLYNAAAKQKHATATYRLASCYEKGRGVKKNPSLAVANFKIAAKESPEAAVALGYMFENGEGVKKSTTDAVRLYRFAASKGLPAGEAALGQCHYYAYGMPKNLQIALQLYESAAANGNEDACVDLGMLYRDGQEITQDYAKAFELFTRAAKKGNGAAYIQLGECYFYGRGVEKDPVKAVEQFSHGKGKGEAEAFRWLGDCYADGHGVPTDLEKAFFYFQKGANAGSSCAMLNLGVCYEKGQGVEVNGQKAFNLYKKAADKMNSTAMNNLGILFERGQFVKQDYQKAFRWYTKAVENDGIEALCNLADCYAEGNGVEKNMAIAVKYYKEGVSSGQPEAQCELGICYYYGKGVEVNYDRALKLFEEASRSEPEAVRHLGIAHYDGSGVPQDDKKALESYFKAAEQGNNDAYLEIGQCHELGRGTAKDVAKAVEYYGKAVDEGNLTAMRCLGNLYFSGNGVPKNLERAKELYERSSSLKWDDLGK